MVLGLSARKQHAAYLAHMLSASGTQVVFESVERKAEVERRLEQPGIDLLLVDAVSDRDIRILVELLGVSPHVPVIVVTDTANESFAIEAVRRGAQDYLNRDQLTTPNLLRTIRCAVERHRHVLALRDLSLTDPLTGLYNRRGFYALAEAQLRVARRNRRRCLLLCADMDGLKIINDRYGHTEGDRALVLAARALRTSFRDSDLLARFGGDEFVAFGYDARDASARILTRRIETKLKEISGAAGLAYPVTLSIGSVELAAGDDLDVASLVDRADQALYRRKKSRALEPGRWLVPAPLPGPFGMAPLRPLQAG